MVVDYVSATDGFFSLLVWLLRWNVTLRQRKKLHRVPRLLCLLLKSRQVLCYTGVIKFHQEPVKGKQWCWWVCFLILCWFVVGILSSLSSSSLGRGCRQ